MTKSWIALTLLAAAASAHAAVVWDEGAGQDLSDDRLAPTAVTVGLGHNIVLGTTGDAGAGVDRDYFRFTIPAGAVLSQLVVLPLTGVSGSSSFIGLQAGPQMTVTPTGGGIDAFYGFNHYDNTDVGTDFLPKLVNAAKSPVPAGTYTVWIQETGGNVSYGLDFVLTPVPEPATALTLALGLAGLGCRRFVLQRG